MAIALQRMPQLPTDQSNIGSIELNGDGESAVKMDVVEENDGAETTAGVVNDMVDNEMGSTGTRTYFPTD